MLNSRRPRLKVEEYELGICNQDRVVLSKAITLIESALPSDRVLADALIQRLLPQTGKSMRIGITGVPGVGKSTFIETFGLYLIENGYKVAVLAIDPSSQRTGGSILGDKTRMEQLSNHPKAYVRPSATGNTLGGVADKTRETILLCEAAGYDILLIETVGVGQSEVEVKNLVDYFLLLLLAGAGDELQGIKKGIMEMADGLAITKSDSGNEVQSKKAVSIYKSALHLFSAPASGVFPEVVECSALYGKGIEEIWQKMDAYREATKHNGFFDQNRTAQQITWMHQNIIRHLKDHFYQNEQVLEETAILENSLKKGTIDAGSASRKLLDVFYKKEVK